MENSATLLLYRQDRKGLVFVIARFLLQHGGNILHADQHQDAELGLFFIRIRWTLTGFDLDQQGFARVFAPLATGYGFTRRVLMEHKRPAVAIFVSRYQHCLVDLLYRHQIRELPCELALIVSNHEDALGVAKFYNVPFYHTPVNPTDKAAAESEQIRLLKEPASCRGRRALRRGISRSPADTCPVRIMQRPIRDRPANNWGVPATLD